MIEHHIAVVRDFLGRYLRHQNFKNDDDIFARGLVNSLFAMQLVTFVEKEFDLRIGNDDLKVDNFRTVNAIVQLISKKNPS